MYYLIVFGTQFLSNYGEFWTAWSTEEANAKVFWDKAEAKVIATEVGGDLSIRASVS